MFVIINANFILTDESNPEIMGKVRKEGSSCCHCPAHIPQPFTSCTYQPDVPLLAPATLCWQALERCHGISMALNQ